MPADPPLPEHDADEVRRLAEEVLGREEFEAPARSLLERILDWIGDLFPEGSGEPGTGSGGGGGSSLLTVLALAVLVLGVVLAVRALARQPRRRRPRADDEPVVEVETRRAADDWLAAAARHEAAGEWKEGIRCRFRALVEALADDGVLPEVPGRTTGEYRVDVREAVPDVADDFVGAADLFDRAWYGDVDTGPDEARRFAGHADRVLTGVGDR